MRLPAFIGFILILTSAWMQFYSVVRETYNGISEYKEEIQTLKRVVDQERLYTAIEKEQFYEFRQTVATLMPEALKERGGGEAGYPIRNLASTVSKIDSEKVRSVIAKTLFESGRKYFKDENYPRAEKVFRQMIRTYSYSPEIAESYFLLAESLFKQNHLEECTQVIQQMIELFPTHELTGFVMIRLGRIFEAQNRTEEAVDIYKTVLRSFPQRDVASQAKASLKGIEL
jgi:TolA-binding protein